MDTMAKLMNYYTFYLHSYCSKIYTLSPAPKQIYSDI